MHNNQKTIPNEIFLERTNNILITQLKSIRHLKNKVLSEHKSNDIHHIRTNLRKAIISFKIHEYLTNRKTNKSYIKSIKRLKNKLGHIRNIDEAIDFTQSKLRFTKKHRLYQSLLTIRNNEIHNIKKQLKSLKNPPTKVSRIGDKNRNRIMKKLSAYNNRRIELIEKLIPFSTLRNNRIKRHAMRIAIRKLRYFMEAISIILEINCSREIKYLKKLQTTLGQINDIVIFREIYRDMTISSSDRKVINKKLLNEEVKSMTQLAKLIKTWSIISSGCKKHEIESC